MSNKHFRIYPSELRRAYLFTNGTLNGTALTGELLMPHCPRFSTPVLSLTGLISDYTVSPSTGLLPDTSPFHVCSPYTFRNRAREIPFL